MFKTEDGSYKFFLVKAILISIKLTLSRCTTFGKKEKITAFT